MSVTQPEAHEGGHTDMQDAGHFTLRTYLTGFFVAAALTAVPFWIVMTRAIADTVASAVLIVSFAIAQILVHTFAFLHLNARQQGGWTLIAYVFTAVLILVTIGGSLWIMYHLNWNMMPGMMRDPASQTP
jgi:cytochrome o ubiquinol oxidase operon protein cyoD